MLLKKVFLICLIFIILGCGSSKIDDSNKVDISTQEYKEIVDSVFKSNLSDNSYFYYAGYTLNYPYIQVSIKPLGNYDNVITNMQAEFIIESILKDLKMNDYKKGGITKYNYEYINIYFYGYDKNGDFSRNGGPFAQIEILDIQNIDIYDVFNAK